MDRCTISFSAFNPHGKLQGTRIFHHASKSLWNRTCSTNNFGNIISSFGEQFTSLLVHRRLACSSYKLNQPCQYGLLSTQYHSVRPKLKQSFFNLCNSQQNSQTNCNRYIRNLSLKNGGLSANAYFDTEAHTPIKGKTGGNTSPNTNLSGYATGYSAIRSNINNNHHRKVIYIRTNTKWN